MIVSVADSQHVQQSACIILLQDLVTSYRYFGTSPFLKEARKQSSCSGDCISTPYRLER